MDRHCVGNAIGAAVAATVLAAVITGCGGAYTKRDFTARADAICAGTTRATRSIPLLSLAGNGSRRLSEIASYMTRALPLVESEARQIRRLPKPSQSAAQAAALRRYLGALTLAVSEYRTMASAASRGSTADFATAATALGANPVTALATSYGLDSCGGPGATVRAR